MSKELNYFLSKKQLNKELEMLYDLYRAQFLGFARKNYPDIDPEDVANIYQDSFLVLYTSICERKLTEQSLTVSLKTFLFSIGKNKLNNFIRDRKDTVDFKDNSKINEMPDEATDPQINAERDEYQKNVRKAVYELGEPCNKLLMLYYFEEQSMKDIAVALGYKSEQVVKNKKRDCLDRLKNNIGYQYKKGDI